MWSKSISAVTVAVVVNLLVALSAFGAAPVPPFNQCPAIGADSACGILIYIDYDGSLRVKTDPSQGPFDGFDDTLIGVQNNSNHTILSIPLKSPSPNPIFAFDGDGICAVDYSGQPIYPNEPAGCPFGPTSVVSHN